MSRAQRTYHGNNVKTHKSVTNDQDLKTNAQLKVITFQDLNTEEDHRILSSMNVLKKEKTWQQEAIRNLTEIVENFQQRRI